VPFGNTPLAAFTRICLEFPQWHRLRYRLAHGRVEGRALAAESMGMTHNTTPANQTLTMTPSEWRLRLAELSHECAGALCDEEGDLLHAAFDLLTLAPEAGLNEEWAGHLPPRAQFEALLGLGAFDSAAIALVPEGASFIVSRAANGEALASLVAGMDEELTSEAETPALAMVSALAACLVEAADGLNHQEREGKAKSGNIQHTRCGDRASDVQEWQAPVGILLN